MDRLTQEHRAREAYRLMNEPLLIEALETVRMNALLALADVDANDVKQVLKYQAIAACTMELKDSLEAVILAFTPDPVAEDGEPGES